MNSKRQGHLRVFYHIKKTPAVERDRQRVHDGGRERERATEAERPGGHGGTGYGLRPIVMLPLNGNLTAGGSRVPAAVPEPTYICRSLPSIGYTHVSARFPLIGLIPPITTALPQTRERGVYGVLCGLKGGDRGGYGGNSMRRVL
ncbi:hypothetical protein HanPI659440_Chr01g0004711 [Helianthus annuus]|nr:hypothetical protein HanPI659440_Chr01g0004711 [Helianthus annuus]